MVRVFFGGNLSIADACSDMSDLWCRVWGLFGGNLSIADACSDMQCSLPVAVGAVDVCPEPHSQVAPNARVEGCGLRVEG